MGCPASTQIWWFHFHRAEPSPWERAEPGAAVQGVWGHQQWEALRHLRLQRVQRLLQAQRPQEAHLQVETGVGVPMGQGMAGWASRETRTRVPWTDTMEKRTPRRAGTPGVATQGGRDAEDGHSGAAVGGTGT